MIMDIKKALILGFVLIISACNTSNIEDDAIYGLDFTIINATDNEYTGYVLYFGSMQQNIFVATDSIKNSVKIYKRNEGPRIGESVEFGKYSILGIEEGIFNGLKSLNHQRRWDGSSSNRDAPYAKVKLSDGSFALGIKTTGLNGYYIKLLIEGSGMEIISGAN
tara:strand:+ start:416 stop:907 length:492 start_codon:yes stop_codon:yes gene_type:complete